MFLAESYWISVFKDGDKIVHIKTIREIEWFFVGKMRIAVTYIGKGNNQYG